jgi:hypothetical protein
MTDERKEPAAAAPKEADSASNAGKAGARKNTAALSAALRANLARRKARDRAVRAAAQKSDSEG